MRVFILHKNVVVSVSAVGQGLQRRCGLPVPPGSPVFKMGLTTEGFVHCAHCKASRANVITVVGLSG